MAANDAHSAAEDRAQQAGCHSNVFVYVPVELTEADLDVIDSLPDDGTRTEAKSEAMKNFRVARCYSVEDIKHWVATNARPENHAETCERAKQHLEALQVKHHEARERVGLAQAEALQENAFANECEATDAMIEIVPTTVPGIIARLSYVFEVFDHRDCLFDDSDCLTTLLESTLTGLRQARA